MNINKIYSISFQKRLRAQCAVLSNGKSQNCRIYEINSTDDYKYFEPLLKSSDWVQNEWLLKLENSVFQKASLKNPSDSRSVFVLEDANNKCLGFIDVLNRSERKVCDILLFASCPQAKHDGIKYIGETILSFICGLSKQDKTSSIEVHNWNPNAYGFYRKCKFNRKSVYGDDILSLNSSVFHQLININTKHTGKRIEYLI